MPDVYQILTNAAQNWPNKTAIYDSKGSLSFAELQQQSDALRDELISLGIKKGKGLGVLARNSREFIIGLFAGIGTGATVMPLSHQLREAELNEAIQESGLHAIIDDKSVARSTALYKQLSNTTGFRFSFTENKGQGNIAPHVTDAAFIRFTSGTTGKAKGVVISHKSAVERIKGAQQALDLTEDDVVIWVLPMAYHFIASIALYVYTGSAIVIADNFMAPTVIDCINKYKGTLLYASPMHLRMLAADKSGDMISSMKRVISTSTSIAKDVCESFYSRYDIPVTQAYGIIEIGLPIINRNHSHDLPESVGTEVEGYSTVILDENGEQLPENEEGLLAIKGPGMFDAYLNPPLMRDEVLTNGYFRTADMAIKDKEGRVFIKGRKSSVINISGNKVFPEEVESLINTLPEVKMSRISGVPHPIMGQIVQVEIILNEGLDIDQEDLISFCRKNLSSFKIPQRVKKVEQIEMTDSGKIKRH